MEKSAWNLAWKSKKFEALVKVQSCAKELTEKKWWEGSKGFHWRPPPISSFKALNFSLRHEKKKNKTEKNEMRAKTIWTFTLCKYVRVQTKNILFFEQFTHYLLYFSWPTCLGIQNTITQKVPLEKN